MRSEIRNKTGVLVLLAFFLSAIVNAQTYSGQLIKDSITNKYTYRAACSDKFVFAGNPTLIAKEKIKNKTDKKADTVFLWLYEINVDTFLLGMDAQTYKAKKIYLSCYNSNRRQVERTSIFLLRKCYFLTIDNIRIYSEYNGGLPVSAKDIKAILPRYSNGENACIEEQCITRIRNNKKRNEFEKIVFKRQKKS